MHYHENDDHIFTVLVEGEGSVRMLSKEYTVKKFDIVVLTAGEPYQLCNTGEGRLWLLGAGKSGANSKPRTRVRKLASHLPQTEAVIA